MLQQDLLNAAHLTPTQPSSDQIIAELILSGIKVNEAWGVPVLLAFVSLVGLAPLEAGVA